MKYWMYLTLYVAYPIGGAIGGLFVGLLVWEFVFGSPELEGLALAIVLVATISGLLLAFALAGRSSTIRGYRRIRSGRCAECGSPLHDSAGGSCPECGAEAQQESALSGWPRILLATVLATVTLGLVCCVCAILFPELETLWTVGLCLVVAGAIALMGVAKMLWPWGP